MPFSRRIFAAADPDFSVMAITMIPKEIMGQVGSFKTDHYDAKGRKVGKNYPGFFGNTETEIDDDSFNSILLEKDATKDGAVKKQPVKNGGFQEWDPPLTEFFTIYSYLVQNPFRDFWGVRSNREL